MWLDDYKVSQLFKGPRLPGLRPTAHPVAASLRLFKGLVASFPV